MNTPYDLTLNLYDAMNAYIAGDFKKGDEFMAKLPSYYDIAINQVYGPACEQEKDKLNKIRKKVDDMKAKPDWDQTKQQIYKENKSQIDSYV